MVAIPIREARVVPVFVVLPNVDVVVLRGLVVDVLLAVLGLLIAVYPVFGFGIFVLVLLHKLSIIDNNIICLSVFVSDGNTALGGVCFHRYI